MSQEIRKILVLSWDRWDASVAKEMFNESQSIFMKEKYEKKNYVRSTAFFFMNTLNTRALYKYCLKCFYFIKYIFKQNKKKILDNYFIRFKLSKKICFFFF